MRKYSINPIFDDNGGVLYSVFDVASNKAIVNLSHYHNAVTIVHVLEMDLSSPKKTCHETKEYGDYES